MSRRFTQFEQGYIDALFFTESGEEDQEITSDHCYLSLAPETVISIKADCDRFIDLAGSLLDSAGDDAQNGHDFWFTRNGHGVGFWDRGYAGDIGNELSTYCRALGEVWVTVGDDGLIYLSQ